jgi:glycosyltransferase involved in cell wall biosynthesis
MRLAVLTDYPEEGWPSMDLVAEMLLKHTPADVQATKICPPFHRRLSFLGGPGRNFDRLANRMWHYPRYLRRGMAEFDAYHLCDHSYSQLVHELPPERTGVFCHDLDTFRCILEPEKDPRPKWFRAMARKILVGLQRARVVFYLTSAVREQIERFGAVDPAKLVRCPVAPAAEFSYQLPRPTDMIYLLHVGSCIPRKRIDVLLETFATVRRPGLRLIQVGGEWTPGQREQIGRLGIAGSVQQKRQLSRPEIAELYRGAAVVLQPSDAEGFGLPVVEALACGAKVVASDIPVLREVGGDAALYCPVGDIARWSDTVSKLLAGRELAPALETRLQQAAKFSWAEHARVIADAYRGIAR